MEKQFVCSADDERIKVNQIVKYKKFKDDSFYKIIFVNDIKVLVVPFDEVKDRIFKNVSERKRIYKSIKKRILRRNTNMLVVYGEHLSNIEKKEVVKKERAEKLDRKREIIENARIDAELKKTLTDMMKIIVEDSLNYLNKRVDEVVNELRASGKNYGFSYHSFTVDEVAGKGIKNLGNQGYRFIFELNGKLVFIKEKGK